MTRREWVHVALWGLTSWLCVNVVLANLMLVLPWWVRYISVLVVTAIQYAFVFRHSSFESKAIQLERARNSKWYFLFALLAILASGVMTLNFEHLRELQEPSFTIDPILFVVANIYATGLGIWTGIESVREARKNDRDSAPLDAHRV